MLHIKIEPTSFDLFTGGKQPELAIAFNLANDNITRYINTLMGWAAADDPYPKLDQLDDRAFVYLRQFLWKGNLENKNKAGYILNPEDKAIILKLLRKFLELRKFHSHFWHDNSCIHFDDDLRQFIQQKHDLACGEILKNGTTDADLYLRQLQRHPIFKENRFITQEGRVFFLSFFLTTGQMMQILQRRKGSKRHDLPEYRFKHKVYSYFCHREGSAALSISIDNDSLRTMDQSELKRIYFGRQAGRILTYLKNKPFLPGEEKIPLLLSDGHSVEDMDTLLTFIAENDLLPGFTFYNKEQLSNGEELDEKNMQQEKFLLENMERQGFRPFRLANQPGYEFEIGYRDLKYITTELFLDQHDPATTNLSLNHFLGVLRDCVNTRHYIYETLSSAGNQAISSQNFSAKKLYNSIYIDYSQYTGSIQERYYNENEWRSIPISPNHRIEKLLIQWHNSFTTASTHEPQHRARLLNAIRPVNVPYREPIPSPGRHHPSRQYTKLPDQNGPEPLLFHLAYYFREQNFQPRSEDNFLEWGVRFLIDTGLVPDWNFELERLVYKPKYNEPDSPHSLKKELRWEKHIPDNYRLYITDNQLNVGIQVNGKIHRLRMGERLFKYLLHWHFHGPARQNKSINDFLNVIASDLDCLKAAPSLSEATDLQLLETFAIPELYFKTKGNASKINSSSIKEDAHQYLTGQIRWIDEQLDILDTLNRHQKNEVILKAYRLFDFSSTDGSKFLRKNEYKQISICHYMLNLDKRKVTNLLERTFRLQRRLPSEILGILYSVVAQENSGLDDLYLEILSNRRSFLKARLGLLNIPGLKASKIKKMSSPFFRPISKTTI